LTSREQEVLALVITGRPNKQIAYDLKLSEMTVKVHRSQAMHKMGARSLVDLVRMADKLGVPATPAQSTTPKPPGRPPP
jgi:FixJ family two-component response regulator